MKSENGIGRVSLSEVPVGLLECEQVRRAIERGAKAVIEMEVSLVCLRRKQIGRERELARQVVAHVARAGSLRGGP